MNLKSFFQLLKNHKKSFSRSTLTALLASVVDFSTLFLLVEKAHCYYVIAVFFAALLGALTNFFSNRFWAFDHDHSSIQHQGLRYGLVALGSMLLNTALVFCFTEALHLRYLLSKVIVSVLVGWAWNYPMHRFYVFKINRRN